MYISYNSSSNSIFYSPYPRPKETFLFLLKENTILFPNPSVDAKIIFQGEERPLLRCHGLSLNQIKMMYNGQIMKLEEPEYSYKEAIWILILRFYALIWLLISKGLCILSLQNEKEVDKDTYFLEEPQTEG